MERPLATLDKFVFSPSIGSYERMQRRWRFAYAKPKPIGSMAVKQFMGPEDDELTISGGIWPEIQPSAMWKIEQLAAVAATGKAMTLMLGDNRIVGRYHLEDIDKGEREIEGGGYAGAISFQLQLSLATGSEFQWPF